MHAKKLAEEDFRNYRVGLIHGKLSSEEKESVMRRFKDGEIDLLVSTTVVEVGVDVPMPQLWSLKIPTDSVFRSFIS